MQFNFNFEAFEKSGKDKNEAIKYLKGLNSSLDFDKLESDLKGDTEAIYNTLKGGNFSFSKPSVEETREKLLKNKENEALRAEFNAELSWLDNKQDYNFYDFKKAKERANSKEGLIKQDLETKEKELKRKEALFEKRLENENIFTKSLRDTADNLGLNAAADVLELGLNKLGFKDENYIFESEKEDIKKRALKSVREKLENNEENFSESEKYALRAKYDELDYKKALDKEKEKLRLIQKGSGYNKSEVEFMEEELGFFHTLFNDTKDTVREFKDEYKSEGIIGADVQKAVNVLKQFEKSELLRHAFSDKKQELQQEYLKNALVIAELNGFDDVGLSKENELYFIKKDKDKEQKYLVNTGFLDNFWDLIENSKFEIAGGIAGGIKGFNSGKSAKGKVVKSILGAAAGSFGGGLMDAKIADMYLNRESDYSRNLEYALQAGLLSLAGDGVIIAAKPMVKGVAKGAKGLYTYAKEHTPLGLFSTIPSQNINAANKIIDEVFTPEMKEELKQAQKDFGGGVRAQDLANPVFEKLKQSFAKKYGQEDKKTKSIEKLAEIFNQNSLKTKQQEMLDLIRSDKDGSTLAYLLEVAKDDVKIQNNLKNMLNLASANVEKNLKNLNINPREIKSILDEFEAGNKAAFKEVENQIAKLYNEDIKVVLNQNAYENIKEDFLQNGVNLDEMTPFLRDLENNVFSKEGVSFSKLNNFRKNLNYYIFNKDKTPNFINTLKKIAETSLKAEIDKGIDNIFKELPKAYESIKELYSTSLKDYAAMKELNESIKNLRLQDSAKSADEVVDSLIKYAKGQGEGGVNNLQKIKAYLGEENNAFLEMQILNRLFKESMVENDRAKVRVFDSESFLNRVKELVGGNELYERKLGKEFLQQLSPSPIPKQLSIDEFLNTLENFKNKENFLKHIEKDPKRKDYLNLIEPTLKEPDLAFKKLENGVEKEKFIKKFSDGKDFFYLLATKDNKETILTAFKTDRINTILKEFNADIIPTFIRQGSKGKAAGTTNESITQPLFKSKEAREFLELVEGFDKLYKNDAIIAKNFTQGTASKLSTSIATSAEGAIKQKVVKGAFDPIFRLLPDGVLFGLFSKQIQGGALRYHLKKALSRSLNYDDFKLKLERELKRTNFNSNTSRLIEKLMQNLEDFNAEKEAKLAQIREAEALKREEELKRLNQMRAEQEQIYQAQEANNLKDILEQNPLKEDFGINFEGFKGKEAVLKLLEEKRGQVSGAFYKEGLGEIDLVWGDSKKGLNHILERRKEDFIKQGLDENEALGKALEFVKKIPQIIEQGEVKIGEKRAFLETGESKAVIALDFNEANKKWILTAYNKGQNALNPAYSHQVKHNTSTSSETRANGVVNESIAQKALNLHEKLYLKDNDSPLKVEYKIVNKDEIKPSFTLSKTQFRSQKQEDLIAKIKNDFNPDLLVSIRGDLKKGNPIITQEGEVISGNHRVEALKELRGENLSKYQKAVKEAFGVELKENEMLVRVVSEDTSEAQIKRFSAASNEGLENNLGEQGVSLFAKYQDKIKALKETKHPFIAEDVYNLKYLVNKALGESSITKENDTSKALFASLARGRNNTILKALNELEKENLEQVSKTANMFFDNAGAFYNLTHDLEMPKMQNLQNYFSDVLVSAAKADFTRAEDFTKLNEDIRAFLDSADKEAMLKLSPNLVSDLLTKAFRAGFARFARLENPSANLFEFLKGLKQDLLEKGAPDLFSGGKGVELKERDEFDFAKELILKGQDSEAKFKLYGNLEELKAWERESKKQSVKDERVELKEALRGVLNQDITNESTGIKARIGIRELNKISSDKAITKSLDNGFSREEHFEASKHLDTLFKKAILREKHKDSKGRENIAAVYRFESVYKNANAKITVLEKIEGNNKIYTLELESLEPAPLNANALNKETEALTQSVESGHNQSTTIAKTDAQSIAQKAKSENALPLNDEPLEVEIIEEAGLNEPMKFLEFQQKKLLTYIKQNTPLRLLERKIELKTRDILNFLEQSALNGKEKAFLMRNFERDLGKIELKIKEKESVKEKIKNAKTSPYPQNADEAVRIQSISKQELEQSNPQQSHLSTKESIAENSQEAKIKEAVKNYNAFYKTLPEYFGSEVGEELMIRQKELIKNLAKDKKVQAFASQWSNPFKEGGGLHGAGLDYKAKVYGKGKSKMMYVDGGGFGSATQQKKEKRLLELELERLHAAFKADFGIDGFISKYAENRFFTALWERAGAYKGIDYGFGVHPKKYYPYYENRIMPSDTITQAKEKLKNELKRIEKESVKESETIDNVKYAQQSLFNEEANFKANFEYETQEAKQKTINKVDAYAKSEAFKALSKDKQEAILSLKSIKPSIMPENIKIQDLQHLQEHFKGKLDEKQREKFLSLFNDTKQNADLVLEVLKNGEKRQEYIKAYQHKESKDLYYIAISKNERDITGIPTTQIQKIINDIAKSERVIKAENFGEISNTAAPLPKQTSPQRSNESIAQKALNLQEIEQALKARISQINDEISANDKAFKEKLKEASKVKPILEALKKEWEALEPFIITWTHTDYSKSKPKKYYNRKPNLSNLWHIEETLDVYKGYARENERQANRVEREIALLEKYVKLLKDKEAEVKAFKAKAKADENALILESRIIPFYNQLREVFKNGQHTTKQILEANNIEQDSERAKEVIANIAQIRQYLEHTFNITPLKEFGTNYAEFYKDGKGAVEKLLAEKRGQVSGAFYKEGLGDIDLVWGDENFGLRHILDKHGDEFEDIAEELDEIIQNGEAVKRKGRDEAYNIEYKGFKVGINKGFNKQGENKWVVTAFNDNIEKTAKTAPANDSTKGASLPLNSKESIAQNSEKLPFEMQVLAEDKLSGDEVRHLANKIGEKSTMPYFKDYLLKMDRDFHARAKDIIREYYKIEPLRKELENQWANVKEAYKNGEMSLKEFKFLSKYKDEKSFLNQVAGVLWHHNDELTKNRGYTNNKYGGVEQGKGDNYYQNLALEYDGALKTLKKWFYYIQKANKQAQRFFNKKELEDFGINFEGFKGKEAVLKLLEEKRGQVSGAFYKEGLGEIDLVWGDENFGLRHILERRTQDFINQGFKQNEAQNKTKELLNEIPQILENGKIYSQNKDKIEIITDKYTLVIGTRNEKKFIITELIDRRNKKRMEAMQTVVGDSFTDEPLAKTPLSSNQESIIPQKSINLAMEKFHYDEKKAKDLLEWHEGSHALTKDENGLPKVFYHYTNQSRVLGKKRDKDFEAFTRKTDLKEQYEKMRPYDKHYGNNQGSRYGIYFTENEKYAQNYATLGGQEEDLKNALERGNAKKYEVFLNIKNPLDLDTIITKQNAKEIEQLFAIKNPPKHIKAININDYIGKDIFTYIHNLGFNEYGHRAAIDKAILYRKDKLGVNGERDILNLADFLSLKGYDGLFFSRKETGREFIVFNPNQIKHIDNKGLENKSGRKYFNEKSENIYQSNPHLGAGLVGGSLGSKAVSMGFKYLEKNPALKEKIITELADTLAQGFDKAKAKYPLLSMLEPRYIIQNERGRKIQAKVMLKELEKEQKENLQNTIRQNLQNLPLNNKPLELSEKQVKLLINRFANARNLKEHLNTRADNRKELYALLNDTLENPQIHFIKEGRDKYLKRYKGDVNEPYFYLLITQDKDKIFITHLKTRDIKYLSRQISNAEQIKKGADIIEALSQRAGDDKASASKKRL